MTEFNRVGQANTDYTVAHTSPDTDADDAAIHHTLGEGPYQAARGTTVRDLQATVDRLNQVTEAIVEQALSAVGEIKIWMLPDLPPHFIRMTGDHLLKADYPLLFNVYQYRYGGNPSTDWFGTPDPHWRYLMAVKDGSFGVTDGKTEVERLELNEHGHDHTSNTTNAVQTSHQHNVSGTTSIVGDHTHNTQPPANTVQRGAGSLDVNGPNHSHVVDGAGSHSHTFGVSSGTPIGDPTHSHTVDVGPSDQADTTHAFMTINLIIRYEPGIDL